jgi:hypothetical protein
MVAKAAWMCTTVGTLAAAAALGQARRWRAEVFEAIYLQRYWQLMDRLSLEALRAIAVGPVRGDDEKTVRNYLGLCEDELEMRARGAISDGTWRVWGPAMLVQLQQWPFSEVWREVQRDAPTDPRLTLLREYDRTGADPRRRVDRRTRRDHILRSWLGA